MAGLSLPGKEGVKNGLQPTEPRRPVLGVVKASVTGPFGSLESPASSSSASLVYSP